MRLTGRHNLGCPGHEDEDHAASGDEELESGCSQTEYGCCPDFVSAASGPDLEGCTIKTSAYLSCLFQYAQFSYIKQNYAYITAGKLSQSA